jgi:hypothetical protein
MSKLTRDLAIWVVLAAMSLGGVAHAQEGDPAPAGATPAPGPGATPAQGPTQTPGQTPVQTPSSTAAPTTTRAPKARPSTRVTVSPTSGRAGTTATVVADVRGGCDPAVSFFQDRTQVGNIRTTRPVTIVRWNGRRLVASYTVSSRDAAGWGRFGISCDMRTDT